MVPSSMMIDVARDTAPTIVRSPNEAACPTDQPSESSDDATDGQILDVVFTDHMLAVQHLGYRLDGGRSARVTQRTATNDGRDASQTQSFSDIIKATPPAKPLLERRCRNLSRKCHRKNLGTCSCDDSGSAGSDNFSRTCPRISPATSIALSHMTTL